MKIKSGDKAVIVSVAGVLEGDAKALESLKKFGLEVEIYPVNPCNYFPDTKTCFADTDENRAKSLERAFLDSDVKLIMCARGGYGCLRLLDGINYDVIRENPKFFVGFSDVTALLLNIYKKTGMVTFHAPMAANYLSGGFFKVLNGETDVIEADNPIFYGGMTSETCVEGTLWGGNLSVLTSMLGSDFIPDEDLILFLEDVNEPVYKLDRMFTQIFRAPELKKRIKALVLGEFLPHANQDLKCLFDSLPVVSTGGFKITHGEGNLTVPVGAKAQIQGGRILFEL